MYKHVLVAVDLSDESEFLLKKAVGIAKRNDAQLSIIHVDVNFSDLYTGLIDVNMSSISFGAAAVRFLLPYSVINKLSSIRTPMPLY